MAPREAARKTIVEHVSVINRTKDDLIYPAFAREGNLDWAEVWSVLTHTRSGTKPISMSMVYFHSEEEAREYAERHPIGSEVEDWSNLSNDDRDLVRKITQSYIDECQFPGEIDGYAFLPLEQLEAAGIHKRGGNTSDDVISFIGEERISELEERFGENWTVAAEMEFCFTNLPHSSPAYIAAAYNYNYFIREDDITAGYLLRDLEILVHGVEKKVQSVEDARKKAGAAGSRKSIEARAKRRMALLDAVEVFVERNPDMAALTDKQIAGLVLPKCVEENPSLWSQGQGQIGEYLDEIRRGEADDEAKARYQALFPQKPPMRFRG